jgi:HK97 family phage portal protein
LSRALDILNRVNAPLRAAREAFAPRARAAITSSYELAKALELTMRASSGALVSPDSAMKISAVNACVKVLAEGVASLPLNEYSRIPGGGRERNRGSSVDRLLSVAPNRWQTPFEFREMMMGHVLLRGNAFALKLEAEGKVSELIPLHPDRMKCALVDGEMVYEWTNPKGAQKPLRQADVFHLRGLSSDGVVGRSAIEDLRDSMGLAISQDKFMSSSYARGGLKNVILEHPQLLNADAAKRIRESWAEKYGGEDAFFKPIVLEEGMKASELTLTAADLQFLESRKFTIAEIARPFRVPLHMIAELDRSTNNNIETQSLEFLTYTLMPWLIRWEQRTQMDLIGVDEDERFAKHNVNGLLRADVAKRGVYYQQALTNGWLNIDEVRELEDRNPLPDGKGKAFRQPLNTSEVGKQPEPAAPVGAPSEDPKPV